MIQHKTVFVVGAGASVPYGLPVGRSLIDSALRIPGVPELLNGSWVGQPLMVVAIESVFGLKVDSVRDFALRLARAEADSIDSLLEKHADDQAFQTIGKAFIAEALRTSLLTMTISPDRARLGQQETDWIRLLWNKMHGGARTFEAFKTGNQVSFITFNFDTMIEHKLALALSNLYPGLAYDDARLFTNGLVDHVHGSVHTPPTDAFDERWLQYAVERIRVVHQGADADDIAKRAAVIRNSSIVAFLGFGYHEENIRKLGLRDLGNLSVLAFGTRYRLGDGQANEIKASLTALPRLVLGTEEQDCYALLKHHHVLRSK